MGHHIASVGRRGERCQADEQVRPGDQDEGECHGGQPMVGESSKRQGQKLRPEPDHGEREDSRKDQEYDQWRAVSEADGAIVAVGVSIKYRAGKD